MLFTTILKQNMPYKVEAKIYQDNTIIELYILFVKNSVIENKQSKTHLHGNFIFNLI